jgi:hypothetical protein
MGITSQALLLPLPRTQVTATPVNNSYQPSTSGPALQGTLGYKSGQVCRGY